jgi:Zn-dependent M28 family amino/carboxypeptidase
VLKRVLFSVLRVAGALTLIATMCWWMMMRMPGKNPSGAAKLTADGVDLRAELKADVQKLAGDIGERNVPRYPALIATAEFIEQSLTAAGLQPHRQTYQVQGKDCHNIEAEIKGASPKIILVGAHYDSVFGAPGANDNGSGVAALLALSRRFAAKKCEYTLRFVAFINEEQPYFQTEQMGSLVYAKSCRHRNDPIEAMISLETIGYFSDEPNTQTYPITGLRAVYPTVGNFIGVVGNFQSRALVRKTIHLLRKDGGIPTEGAALPSIVPGVGWSDQWAFWQCGYRGIMITDTAPFRYPHYHETTDTPDKLDYDRFALVVNGMEKVVAELATNGP